MGKKNVQMDVQARCPFFRRTAGTRITCEGPFDGAAVMLLMNSGKQTEIQLRVFCCEHYEKCEIYRMVMASKYEE